MINRLIEFSAENRPIIFVLTAVLCLLGLWSARHLPLDALPDLSDTQVIVYSRWDQSPEIVDAQVTYPVVSAMVGAPRVKTVRGFSDFGYSFVYVIFEEGTDLYWARSRTMEYLTSVLPRLPKGVQTELGPDATSVGWVFQYALVDESGKHSLADLRSYQDWYLRYYLKSVPGVADVAAIGGHVKQYQVTVDPNRLQAYDLPITRVTEAVRRANNEASGRLVEFGGAEYMIRGHGYARSIADFESVVVGQSDATTPIRLKDVGQVSLGPDIRRGVSDLDGRGEVVSGVVIMRHGENALDVIERVKAKLQQIAPGLPAGVKIVPVYDRAELIRRSVDKIVATLIEIMITVALVIFVFLWHVPSAIIPVVTIPIAMLISFIPFRLAGVTANIMSLGGLAIAIGAMADAAIVVVEQTHKKLEAWRQGSQTADYRRVIIDAVKEVAGPSFFALLVIAVSFLPVLTLEAQEGRLFKPLAYTKTLIILIGAVLAVTLDPALRLSLTRLKPIRLQPRWLSRIINAVAVGTIHPEEQHRLSRWLIRLYEPVALWSLRRPWWVIGAALMLMTATLPIYQRLGSEFMPPLDEGSLFYMPTTMPGLSVGEAQKLLQITDRVIKGFPEVDRVIGKAGRAETPTDPAPLSMLETVISLRPKDQWRKVDTWYSGWAPQWLLPILRRISADHLSREELVRQLNAALTIPGLANSWTMPIKARVDMLSTGIRTPVGLKVSGADLQTIDRIGAQAAALLQNVRGTRSVFAERSSSGRFLDIEWRRDELARYGLSVEEAQAAVQHAIGGENVTTTIEGRERYPVNVRYLRDYRSDVDAIGRVLVSAAGGQRHIPLSQLAAVNTATGPAMIRNEDGLLTGYVYVDIDRRDPNGYVEEAKSMLRDKLPLPPGYAVAWSGEYEAHQRVKERLTMVVPITLMLIFFLIYLNTGALAKTLIVMLAVPFSAIGAIWILYLLGYNLSVGVWVGLISLLGVDAATGIFMLLYLDLAYAHAEGSGQLNNRGDLQTAILQGAVKRLRPKLMTVMTMMIGLVPILWASGDGADVMKRIAAPMVGGILTSFLLELLIYPPIYELWKWHFVLNSLRSGDDRL